MLKKLAKIIDARLEIKERGILNFWINVNYEDGFSQGVGGIALDTYDDEKDTRVGTAYGCEMIRQLLITLNVNDFSEMKGQIIYVLGEGTDFSFKPKGVETLRVNGDVRTIIFKDIYDEFKEIK